MKAQFWKDYSDFRSIEILQNYQLRVDYMAQ